MEVTEGKLRRLKNLPSFKGKTDEEIIEYLKNKPDKPRKPRTTKVKEVEIIEEISTETADYNKRYNAKLKLLKEEFGIDMNDSNDAESLRMLVRLLIQSEDIDQKIREDKTVLFDDKRLKNLGDFQKTVVTSIADLQEKLGITRKVRKEKQVDDIPQYLKAIRLKARDFWNRTTTKVECPKCQIELSRFWLNFPDLASKVVMELECWKCHEKVVYVK